MSVAVRDNPEESRYEALVDGELGAFLRYHVDGSVADFVHTETLPAHAGHGLGSTLVEEALADARRRGWQVRPYCPFVRKYLVEHPDQRDLVPPAELGRFALGE